MTRFAVLALAVALVGCSVEEPATGLESNLPGAFAFDPGQPRDNRSVVSSGVSGATDGGHPPIAAPRPFEILADGGMDLSRLTCIDQDPSTSAQPCLVIDESVYAAVGPRGRAYDALGRLTARGRIDAGTLVAEETWTYGPAGLERWAALTSAGQLMQSRTYSYGADGLVRTLELRSGWYSAQIVWDRSDAGALATGTASSDAGVGVGGYVARLEVDGGTATFVEVHDYEPSTWTFDDHARLRIETTSSASASSSYRTRIEYDADGRPVFYEAGDGDIHSSTRNVWDSGRLIRAYGDTWTTGPFDGTGVTDFYYDADGHLLARRIQGFPTDHGQPLPATSDVVLFSNACGSGEPIAVTHFTASGSVETGDIVYSRDRKGRILEAQYFGAAAKEFGVSRREWRYCDE